MVNDGYGANAGITYLGFSIDGFYTKENGAVNLRNVPLAANGILGSTALFTGGPTVVTSCNAALGNCPNYLLGTITDNEAWDVMAKYTSTCRASLGARRQHEGCSLRRFEGCAMRAAFCEGHPLRRLSARRPVEPGRSAVLLQRKHDGRRL